MAEEQSSKKTWLKAIGTSIFGLFSGAVLMYVSPLVNSVVKPAKPLANFAHQPQGLQVTFSNRSTNATQGWWDFGDGSTLEPYSPDQETVVHKYPRPGVYTAKLSLRNFLGDENERSVAVTLDASSDLSPTIEAFQAIPLKPEKTPTAPATIEVVSSLKNAELSIWSAGDNKPLEITHDPAVVQNRLITFTEPGSYTIRLVAVNGKQTVEKTETIHVAPGNQAHARVALNVDFEAVRVTKAEKVHHRMIAFPADQSQSTFVFKKEFHPQPGFQVVEVRFTRPASDPALRNVKLEIAADKSKAYLTGELVKAAGSKTNVPLPSWHAEVMLLEEAQTASQTRKNDPIVVTLNLPMGQEKAVTEVPMPYLSDKWIVKQRHVTLAVRDHKQTVWTESKLPCTSTMIMRNKSWHVTASESGGKIRLEVQENRQGLQLETN